MRRGSALRDKRIQTRRGGTVDMTEFWEAAFVDKQLMWGLGPSQSALLARDYFARLGVRDVLMPGIGYGRNAKVLVERGMSVTGIEVSQTAIDLARSQLGLELSIHHGSVTSMPFDDQQYDAVFCYGLLYLLDAAARAKFLADCYRQLRPGGAMIFTVISKRAPMYGQGSRLAEDWYELPYGVKMFFYDAASVERELGPYGLATSSDIDEPAHGGSTLPFINVICRKGSEALTPQRDSG